MGWELKLHALNSICRVKLTMSQPGEWSAYPGDVEIHERGLLKEFVGTGPSVVEAVESLWRLATDLELGSFLVVNAYGARRQLVWNGFMWADYHG
jgi:hypothetical protein